jgi:hypothetical protein
MTAALPNDAVNWCETEAALCPSPLGREEGLEESRLDLVTHAGAVVSERNGYVFSGEKSTVAVTVRIRRYLEGRCLNCQATALRHGVAALTARLRIICENWPASTLMWAPVFNGEVTDDRDVVAEERSSECSRLLMRRLTSRTVGSSA